MEYKKDFDGWNSKKKILNNRIMPDSFFFLEGEIWWASIGINIGDEIDGKHENFERPILIIKKFNEIGFIGLPISSKENTNGSYLKILYRNEINYVSLRQFRYLNIKRLLRLIRKIDDVDLSVIKDKIIVIFN